MAAVDGDIQERKRSSCSVTQTFSADQARSYLFSLPEWTMISSSTLPSMTMPLQNTQQIRNLDDGQTGSFFSVVTMCLTHLTPYQIKSKTGREKEEEVRGHTKHLSGHCPPH